MEEDIKVGIVVFAKNVELLSGFYQNVFGLSLVLKEREKCVLESRVLTLTIHGIPQGIAESIKISAPPQLRETTPIKVCYPVISIEEVRKVAYTLDGCLYPQGNEWENTKFRACDGYDPEGNIFQVRESK